MNRTHKTVSLIFLALTLISCQDNTHQKTPSPQWSNNMTIYEVNLRQFTEAGTIQAFREHLPRLKEMGVGILWFMPIHPIGEKNRKGTLGSYYSVKDYYSVNPEFGSLAEFKSLVEEIHSMGMVVILDWVANHCAWDNPLVTEHPDWFTRDKNGNFQPPEGTDWTDVIDFDYTHPDLRKYMLNVMEWWVREIDVDGFRCDVAGMVPLDFWETLRPKLDAIKPVFMLAEWDNPDLLKKAFDADYNWDLYYIMKDIVEGKKGINAIKQFFRNSPKSYPTDAIRMNFLDNHDKNSWDGVMTQLFGSFLKPALVMTFTIPGMPLIYSGQESLLDKQLAFFDKDLIEWGEFSQMNFYRDLVQLRLKHPSLWGNSQTITFLGNLPGNTLGYYRISDNEKILVLLNFSTQPISTTQIINEESSVLLKDQSSAEGELGPWGYGVYNMKE